MSKKVIGLYDGHHGAPVGTVDRQYRFLFNTITGFKKLGYICDGIYKFSEFEYKPNINFYVLCGPNNKNTFNQFKVCENKIWIDISSLQTVYRKKLNEEVVHLHFNDTYDTSRLIYYDHLSDDRSKKLNAIAENRYNSSINDYVIVGHHHAMVRDGFDERQSFLKEVVRYCVDNQLKVKVCFHPTIDDKRFNYYKELYGNNVEYHVKARPFLKSSKCIVFHGGRLLFESVIFGIPFVTRMNYVSNLTDPNNDYKQLINNPESIDAHVRQKWLNWVSYQNWSQSELISGEAQDKIINLWKIR